MRTIVNDKPGSNVSANFISKHIPANPQIKENHKKSFRHKPYACDFGKETKNDN